MTKEQTKARLAKKIEELKSVMRSLDRVRFAIATNDFADLRIIEAKEEIDDAVYDLERALESLKA